MKLNNTSISQLDTILTVCGLVAIDNIIIENGKVSGVNDDRSCAIFSDQNVPELETDVKMGLSRLSVLQARMSLFRADPKISIEAKKNDKNEISNIEISGSNAKVQFRCTSPSLIKAPKSINTDPLKQITIRKDQLPVILAGAKTMGAKKLTLAIKAGEVVSFEFTDTNQDACTIILTDPAEHCGEEASETIVNYYPTEILLPLFRAAAAEEANQAITAIVGANGVIQLMVSGHLMTVLSLIDAN